jgi:carboxypeptidase C (cathepsin A)
VCIVQGQFDWKDGGFSNEIWIDKINWPGRSGYLSSERRQWLMQTVTEDGSVVSEPVGWVQTYSSLTELIVNNAGHLAPMDQPERLYSMIQTFISGKDFLTN